MANEVLTGSGGGTDILVEAIASKYVHVLLADRASMRNHPALVILGPNLISSTTEHIAEFGLDGYDLMTSRTEIQQIDNNALTTAEASVTPAPYRLAYDYSDFMKATDPTGVIDSMRLAQSIAMSAAMTLTNLIAQAIDGFNQVGSTGVAMTHDTFLAAQFALEQALVPGPYCCCLKPKAFNDWQSDLESRGGVTQWVPATQAMQVLRGPGAKGVYNGVEVHTSSKIQSINGGTDWASAMWGYGAVGYKELALGPAPRSQFVVLDVEGVIRVAEARVERTGETVVVGHYNVGTINPETARGRTIISVQ